MKGAFLACQCLASFEGELVLEGALGGVKGCGWLSDRALGALAAWARALIP